MSNETPSTGAPAVLARLGWSEPTIEVPAYQWRDGVLTSRVERVVEETPVALVYNEIAHVVMMATPHDLEDFGLGFSVTEEIVESPAAVLGVDIVRFSRGIELKIAVTAAAQAKVESRNRRLTGRTGCGICGADGIEAVLKTVRSVRGIARVRPEAVRRAVEQLAGLQPLNAAAGTVHAAAWADPEGTVQLVREDVGRHNALDKLVGACLRAGVPSAHGFVVVTSRASFEMVQKAVCLGAGMLVAVSGPTALAIRLADASGITLVGFAREARMTAYTHVDRVGA